MAAAVLAFAACSDAPLDPAPGSTPSPTAPAPAPPQSLHDRQEQLARQFALALNSPALRQSLMAELDRSPSPERKVHFQALLAGQQGRFRQALARAAGVPEQEVAASAAEAPALETYFPVPEHRAAWRGGAELLVATAVADGDPPVAFDVRGRRRVLDPARPPAEPVLALVPAEQPFTGLYPSIELCPPEGCGGGGAFGSGTGGLYMTYASFTGTFESWLKGSPEFEVHILGQDGGSASLKDYQCAGEHAGGPYAYDQNSTTWSGSVMLFSQSQLETYQADHPGQAVRILVIEDDDGACVIKTDKDQLSNLLKLLDAAYRLYTGGKASLTDISKLFKNATTFQQLFTSAASLIKTNDDIVGSAIEDVVVGQTWSGANWIVKGNNNVTNGGIRLEMR
jgi:hypothetical protein